MRRACALDLNVNATLGQETLELWASLWRFFVHVGILGEVRRCSSVVCGEDRPWLARSVQKLRRRLRVSTDQEDYVEVVKIAPSRSYRCT